MLYMDRVRLKTPIKNFKKNNTIHFYTVPHNKVSNLNRAKVLNFPKDNTSLTTVTSLVSIYLG